MAEKKKPANPPDQKSARPSWAEGLADEEYRFVDNYLIDLNGTKAAQRMDPNRSDETAAQFGYRMKARPHVVKAIDLAMAGDSAGPRQWLVTKLQAIADSNLADFIKIDINGDLTVKSWDDLPRELTALVKRIKKDKDGNISIELHDSLKAVEILGKVGSIGLTRESVNIEGRVTLEDLVKQSFQPPGEKT